MGLFSIFGRSSTVYFPGCITYFKHKNSFELYQEIFSKLGINFRVLDKQICSGLEPWEAGYEAESRKLARKNFDIFNEEGIKSIITTSPGCYKMFLQNYQEFLPYWNIEVINLWELILEKLKDRPYLIRRMPSSEKVSSLSKDNEKHKDSETAKFVTYHDPCYLGRYCKIYGEPRKILELIGYEIEEMDNSKEDSFCCGSCGGLPRISPLLANRIAKERILQAKRIGVNKIVVIGFENYDLLKDNVGNTGIEVFEMSEILANAMGIKRSKNLQIAGRKNFIKNKNE